MPRVRPALPCLACAAAVVAGAAGCAGSAGSSDSGGTARAAAPPAVHAWDVRSPYLPPPDPSIVGRHADSASPGGASAAQPGAASAQAGATSNPKPTGADAATTPRSPTAGAAAPGAPSDAEVAAELRQAYGGQSGDDVDQAAIDPSGLAIIPPTAPRRLVALMQGANEVARKPYVYGGGHGRNPNEIWTDSAYDCSGSVSYALAAAGYLDGPVDSTTLMSFGRPGPGRWVTIYANAGHTFMVVAGLRFDTSGRQITGTRWQSANGRSYAGFTVRHPRGL